MHELGMCESVVDAVERRAQGRRVTSVKLHVGTLHRVVEPALQQAFAMAATGTVAEGAAVELVVVPLVATCRDCRAETKSEDPLPTCAACGGTDVDVRGGDELMLESIQLAEV
jgi:hydrogenase nickel incorporation protein HypA/HybF